MTQPPPALAKQPQFEADYWKRVPRQRVRSTIKRVNYREEDDTVEFVLANNAAFRRRKAEIEQLVVSGIGVEVEIIGSDLITGMYLPEIQRWAFRMTPDDLAAHAERIVTQQYNAQMAAHEAMAGFLNATIQQYLVEQYGAEINQADDIPVGGGATVIDVASVNANIDTMHLAKYLMEAMANAQ